MNAAELRPYLPVTLAAVIVLALIVLGYLAGYRAGKAAGAHAYRSAVVSPR